MKLRPALSLALLALAPLGLLAEGLSPQAQAAPAESLPLASYLAQVAAKNDALQAAHGQNQSLDLAALEPETAFSPSLSAAYSHNETQMQPSSAMMPASIYGSSWDLGVGKLFATGTHVDLGYQSAWSVDQYGSSIRPDLSGFNPTEQGQLYGLFGSLESTGTWYTASPTLTISQSLWKGFMARGFDIAIQKVQASYGSLKRLNDFKAQSILYQAEAAYLQLALARATVAVQEEALERNMKILEWSKRRAAQNLVDEVDVLQTEAQVKAVEVGLATAREGLRSAARSFNALRGRDDDQVDASLDELALPDPAQLQRKDERLDLKAARLQLKADDLSVDEVIEKYRPDLSVFYSAALNGGSGSYSTALSDQDRLAWAAGVKLSANIDLPLISKVVEGAKTASSSSQHGFEQQRRDLDKDWDNLQSQWESVQQRLAQVDELVALQKEKSEREKVRFNNGRTTNYQVLSFENDYSSAQLMRLGLVTEARVLAATAKLYNGAY
jgi:outer membrane protein TolC